MASCLKCHRSLPDTAGNLRRGLCRACYLRAWRGAELPADARCALCPEQRHAVLRWTRLEAEKIVTCQNCGFIADKLRPRPATLAELTELMARDRRRALDRRRNYVIDPADPTERRNVGRRRGRRRATAL